MKTNVQMVNLLDQFQYGCQHHFKNIFKSIKSISVSSKDYYTFTNNYFNATQVNSFKQPDNESYPILKNNELISLTKKTYKCSNDKRIQSSRTKANTTFQSSFLVTNPTFHQRPRPQSKLGFTVTDPRRLHKKNLLRDLIFHEPSYDRMEYDERKIFHREKDYLAFIKDRVEDFKTAKYSNTTSEVHRYFNDEQVYLQCKSIVLEFKNVKDKSMPTMTFELPFAYLPLFYYKDFDNMKYIFLALVYFNNKYDKITLNDEALYHLLKTSVEYTTSQIPTQTNETSFSFQQSRYDEIENIFSAQNIESRENAPRIQIRDHHHDSSYSSSLLSNQYNILYYLWITPVNTYQLEIKMPEVTMVFPEFKKEINKTIDTELLFFLIKNNFLNWDFYVVNYLLSLKAFRWIIQSSISKSFRCSFKEHDIIKQKAHDEIMKHITIRSFNGIDYYSLSRKRIKALTEKEKEFFFYQTDDVQNNHLCILHNYQVTILNNQMQSNKEFIFSFNLKQMRQLNAVSHWQLLTSFFNKIVIVDMKNDSIRLNYDVFEHLNINEVLQSDKMLSESSKGMKKKESNLTITIVYPYLEKIDYLKELNVQATSIISDTNESVHRVLTSQVLEEICQNDLCNWPTILSTFNGFHHPKTITIQMKRNVNKDKSSSITKSNTNKRFTYDKSMLL